MGQKQQLKYPLLGEMQTSIKSDLRLSAFGAKLPFTFARFWGRSGHAAPAG
jgi:hypothetical protein